jgi:hypothetical protein
MTQLTTPTETLVRIPFTGLTDFQPLALAPGLPMLDVNKLTYQVLLGWFGDLLAEPELEDEGVMFHAQRGGTRQVIVERALVTSEELHGTLQPQYEKLKNSLFDVRPVSPSERLIFNRLQPPIGNHEGFLYRVQTESGEEQLVWCWGFQRRTQYGDARLCGNHECSMLFLHDSLADPLCPHCGTSFGMEVEEGLAAGSKIPIRKASAAAAIVLLAGGTLWIGSHLTNLSADTVQEVAAVEPLALETNPIPYEDAAPTGTTKAADEDVSTRPDATSTQIADAGTAEPNSESSVTEPPELFVGFNDLPNVDEPATTNDSEPAETAPAFPELTLPAIVSLPDLPDNFEPSNLEPLTPESSANVASDDGEPKPSLPIVEADTFPQEKTVDGPGLPDVLPEPLVAQSEPVTFTETEDSTSDSVTTTLESNAGLASDSEPVARPETTKPALPNSKDLITLTEPLDEPTVESPAESLSWHGDYLAAYVEASQEKRYLLMLFRETIIGGEPLATTDSVFAPSMRPMLEQFSRVELPLNAAMPILSNKTNDTKSGALPNLLLKHRSFRHLGMQSGIAVVDLTDPTSTNHARVVSVLPLPESGQFNDDDLMLALTLPKGAISQRTLLFAIRSTVPDSSLSMREFSPTLVELAHRNSRYMANAGRVGSFDQESRKQRIEQDFGPQADLKQLVFATESETSIQDAALQAVANWIGTSESFDILDAPAEAMGMDMFQNSESGRWFVTCFVIR